MLWRVWCGEMVAVRSDNWPYKRGDFLVSLVPQFHTHPHHFQYYFRIFITMGWFDNNSYQADAYDKVSFPPVLSPSICSSIDQVVNAPHEAKLSHELIAAAASYEVRAFEYRIDAVIDIDPRCDTSGCQSL